MVGVNSFESKLDLGWRYWFSQKPIGRFFGNFGNDVGVLMPFSKMKVWGEKYCSPCLVGEALCDSMGNIHKALTFVLHNIVHMIWLVFRLLFTSTWVFVHNYEDFFFCLNHEQLYSSFSYPCYWKKLDFIFFLPLFKPSIFHYSIFVIEKKII